jgi:thiamine pyrophosphate-dependent acetolactate synthase large subunit-like protein
MPARDALAVIHGGRGDRDIVVTTMTPARDWMTFTQHALDVVMVPSAMGHATSIGLGLALAQPTRRVIVCNGDGSMLMNLGSLVSITAARATNLVVLVFDNGVYEVTGAQPIPSPGVIDFVSIARGSGFASVFEHSNLDAWRAEVEQILNAPGPTLALLHVDAVVGIPGPRSPGPAAERARRFSEALDRNRVEG